MTTAPLLSLRGLCIDIRRGKAVLPILSGVSFDIGVAETYALVGESGCGKSMTALALARLLPDVARLRAAELSLGGTDLLRLTEAEMRDVRGRRLAMIFQEPGASLNPVLSVGRQLGESLARRGRLDARARLAAMQDLLGAVGIADAPRRLGEFPFQLSGGIKQRVMIAMALAGNPQLLIADEPTTALDVTIQAEILDLLRRLQAERRMSMLLISHDLGIVAAMADRVGVMYAGEIVESAPTEAFFSAPRHPYTQMLFAALPDTQRRGLNLATIPGQVPATGDWTAGCRFAERCPAVLGHCRLQAPPQAQVDAGHWVRCHLYAPGQPAWSGIRPTPTSTPDAAPGEAAAVLAATDVKVHFPIRAGVLRRQVGAVRAVDGVSFVLQRGRTVALVGESGCGKTTVGKALLQLNVPVQGSVRLGERELVGLSRQALQPLRRRLQMIFQDPYASLNPRLRVGEIIAEGMQALGVVSGAAARERAVAHLLAQVGLPEEAALRYPHEFSGGQRQRIAIARTLAVRPEVIVCDEPTSALDVSVQAQILNLLRELQQALALSYLFITHNFAVVEYLAHDVAVMYLGRIVERGSVDEVLRQPRHPYTVALLSAVPVPDPAAQRSRLLPSGEMPRRPGRLPAAISTAAVRRPCRFAPASILAGHASPPRRKWLATSIVDRFDRHVLRRAAPAGMLPQIDKSGWGRGVRGVQRLFEPVWQAVLLVLLGALAVLAWISGSDYETMLEQEYRFLESHARIADAQLSGLLRAIDLLLSDVAAERAVLPAEQLHSFEQTLGKRIAKLPEVGLIFLTDAGGKLQAVSNPERKQLPPGYDASKRQYFSTHRDRGQPAGSLFISRPFKSVSKVDSITLSKAIVDAQGRFQGVVAVGIALQYFDTALSAVRPEEESAAITLFNRSGDILYRLPDPERWVGHSIANGEAYAAHLRSGRRITRTQGRSQLDGRERLYVFRWIGDYNLGVSISRDLGTVLAPWYAGLARNAALLLAAFGASAISFFAGRRRRASARGSAAPVCAAGKEAVLVTDADGNITAVNAAFSRITGYAAGEAIGCKPSLLRSGRHPPSYYRQMWESLVQRGQWRGEVWNRRKNGEVYAEWLEIDAQLDEAGRTSCYVARFTDITAQKQTEEAVWRSTPPERRAGAERGEV